MAVFTKRFRDVAREVGAPQAETLAKCHAELVAAIENRAWSEKDAYYYLQRDENTDRWFLSINGQCEESRETDVMPFYAAEACEIPERIQAVGRVLNRALLKDRVFPMPTRWPTYSWYSPYSPNGVDMGDDCGQIGGAWDTPYFHGVELLSRLGLQQAVQRAVFRRAEVTHRDQDCLESYYQDGTIDPTRFYDRDQYMVSGTAHLSAIIEGLFGITPARTGFAEVNLRPNLPLYRRHRHSTHPSDWSGRDNRICVRLGLRGAWRWWSATTRTPNVSRCGPRRWGFPPIFACPWTLAAVSWPPPGMAGRFQPALKRAWTAISSISITAWMAER